MVSSRSGSVPPAADAGPDREVAAGEACTADVTLDGSRSTDPDGDVLTYRWEGEFGTADGVNP